jgi:hypothetical protein
MFLTTTAYFIYFPIPLVDRWFIVCTPQLVKMLLSMLLFMIGAVQAITDARNGQGLTEFPTNVSADVTVLNLATNSLSHVPPEALQVLPVLSKLDLGSNSLSVFPNLTAVAGSLTQLVLHYNKIGFVDARLVEVLYRLITLTLAHNKLVTFPELASGACHSLRRVDLRANPLASPLSFRHFTALKELNLMGTSLTEMPELGAALLPILKELFLEGPFTMPASTFSRLTALNRFYMPRSLVTALTNPCSYVRELELRSTPLAVCACQHLWIKLVATMGPYVLVPDANCSGTMWSAMTLQHFQEACAVQPRAGT